MCCLGIRWNEAWQALDKDLAKTGGIITKEFRNRQVEVNLDTTPWQVMRMTLIPAVNPFCCLVANGAAGLLRQGTGLNTYEGLVNRDLLNEEPRDFEMQQLGVYVGTSLGEG